MLSISTLQTILQTHLEKILPILNEWDFHKLICEVLAIKFQRDDIRQHAKRLLISLAPQPSESSV